MMPLSIDTTMFSFLAHFLNLVFHFFLNFYSLLTSLFLHVYLHENQSLFHKNAKIPLNNVVDALVQDDDLEQTTPTN